MVGAQKISDLDVSFTNSNGRYRVYWQLRGDEAHGLAAEGAGIPGIRSLNTSQVVPKTLIT
jgi:hypothetical protein